MRKAHQKMWVVICAGTLVACGSTPEWLPGRQTETVADENIVGSDVSHYLRSMYRLIEASPADQLEVFAELENAARRSPTTTNRLALALARVTSGHTGTAIGTGRQELEALMADPVLLVDSERHLVALVLNELDRQAEIFGDSAARAQRELGEVSAERDGLAAALARSEREQAALRAALVEAEEKLNAITRIERSIRERTDDDPTP